MYSFPNSSRSKDSPCNARETGNTGSIPGLRRSLQKEMDVEKAKEKKKRQRNQRSNWHHLLDHRKSKGIHQNIYCFIDYTKAFDQWITTNCGKFLNRWEYQITETCMQVKKQQLEPDMEQRTGSKLGKEYVKAVYCHPTYLTYMQNISCKMLGRMNHSYNQDCQEKKQQPQICRWFISDRKWRGTKEPLNEVKIV